MVRGFIMEGGSCSVAVEGSRSWSVGESECRPVVLCRDVVEWVQQRPVVEVCGPWGS